MYGIAETLIVDTNNIPVDLNMNYEVMRFQYKEKCK